MNTLDMDSNNCWRGSAWVSKISHVALFFHIHTLLYPATYIIQPDITWLGGLTEARRVVSLASAYDVMVIPHGSSVFSYHLQFAYLSG